MTEVIDSASDLLSDMIPADQPVDWEFLGADRAADSAWAERHHGREGRQ